MKTTLELPDRVMQELQRRATSLGRDVNDLVAEILAADVSPPPNGRDEARLVPKTLPRIKVRPVPPTSSRTLTTQEWCDWLKEVDAQVEVERYEKALGHQHVDSADG